MASFTLLSGNPGGGTKYDLSWNVPKGCGKNWVISQSAGGGIFSATLSNTAESTMLPPRSEASYFDCLVDVFYTSVPYSPYTPTRHTRCPLSANQETRLIILTAIRQKERNKPLIRKETPTVLERHESFPHTPPPSPQ